MSEYMARRGVLWRYMALTYLAVLINAFGYLARIEYSSVITDLFAGAVYFSSFLLLVLPVWLLSVLWNKLLSSRRLDGAFRRMPALRFGLVYAFAVLGATALQLFIFSDKLILNMFGFHFNGFVWNLICTKGGVDSMGAGGGTVFSFVVIGFVILAVQTGLLLLLVYVPRLRTFGERLFTRTRVVLLVCLLLVTLVFEKLTYGISAFKTYTPVLAASHAFPLYIPITFSRFAKSMGFHEVRDPFPRMSIDTVRLNYPLHPMARDKHHPLYNIVWLAVESLRADMLDPQIMPVTDAFAKTAARFHQHYSGGNGTRMGVFSMFYGLYGSYWFSFLPENRGPVLMDLVMDEGYQVDMFTSAAFTYPEFDKTVFARVPSDRLHEVHQGPSWERDRVNVTDLLKFIDQRDPSRPFMTFMFFESPHAPYEFPEETVIRKPYATDMNYLTMDTHRDATLIKNRYINSCRHLDTQLERVIRYLEQHHLLESTIVLITGDHGEEFMEKGWWGHNCAFTEEQTRVPLVLRIPGRAPQEVARMTSHLDIPATIMTAMGVSTPPEDYSHGFDLFGDRPREFAILADWDHLVYVDDRYKAHLPIQTRDFFQNGVTTRDDMNIKEDSSFYETNKPRLLQVLNDLRRFQK